MKTVIEYAGELYPQFTNGKIEPFKDKREFKKKIHPGKIAVLILDGPVNYDLKVDKYWNKNGWVKIKKTISEQ